MQEGLISAAEADGTERSSTSKGILGSLSETVTSLGKQAANGAMDLVTPEGMNPFAGQMRLHGANGPAPASLQEVDAVLSKAGSKGLDALMGPRFEQQALRGAEEMFSRVLNGRDRSRARDGHEIGG